MSSSTRVFVGFLVPVFTLLLGWQLGVRYATTRYDDAQRRLEDMLIGRSQSGTTVMNPKEDVNIELLWTTWKLLINHYIRPEELNTQEMVEGAVSGMVDAVGDPYTLFMTREESDDFVDGLNGDLEGIGAELTVDAGIVRIVRLIEGSPAERSGLLPDDFVIKVDDTDVSGFALPDVIKRIRGPKGSAVVLTVMREKNERTFTITREQKHNPSATNEVQSTAGDDVGILTISQFGSETIPEVRNHLANIGASGVRGLVVDLRYNGGGYLDGAIDLTSMFIEQGRVVTVAGRTEQQHHDVTGRAILPNLPVVVLINGGSASASEIFAGAMQDHGRATIVGTQSFGKGTVQEVIKLPGGSALRVTTATWLTPDGTDLGKHGVTPDIIVERTTEDAEADRDPQLEAAMRALQNVER